MPKELHEIKTFLTGTITSPDAKDIPEDAAQESLNIDPVSSDGKLIGIGKDEVITDYIEDAPVSFDSNSMKVTNVQGQRNLIGISDDSNEISQVKFFLCCVGLVGLVLGSFLLHIHLNY